MAKFRGVELVKEVRKALDRGQAQFVTETQSKLSGDSPVMFGRLASSWYVGKGSPNRTVAPERDEPGPVVIEKYSGKITLEGDWWVSSNLPYSERATGDPRWSKGGKGGEDWFSRIQNNLNRDANRIFQRELKKIK